MRDADDGIDRLSIRAGMVLAVECFERALALFGVDDPALEHLLDVLWTFPDAADLADWEFRLEYASAPGLAHRTTVAGAVDEIWVGIDPALRQLYEAVEDVGRGNLYTQERYDVHIPAVRRVLTMAQALGVDVPPVDALLDFRWVDTAWAWAAPSPTPAPSSSPADPGVVVAGRARGVRRGFGVANRGRPTAFTGLWGGHHAARLGLDARRPRRRPSHGAALAARRPRLTAAVGPSVFAGTQPCASAKTDGS